MNARSAARSADPAPLRTLPLVLETQAPVLDLSLVTPRGLDRRRAWLRCFDALKQAFDDAARAREQA